MFFLHYELFGDFYECGDMRSYFANIQGCHDAVVQADSGRTVQVRMCRESTSLDRSVTSPILGYLLEGGCDVDMDFEASGCASDLSDDSFFDDFDGDDHGDDDMDAEEEESDDGESSGRKRPCLAREFSAAVAGDA